jgi:hypothetical protein
VGVARLFHELVKLGGEGAQMFLKKNIRSIGEGGPLEATFFSTKSSPNGNLKINPLTLSRGFFMKIFNNFNKKIEEKGGAPPISTIFSFNTFLKKKPFSLFYNQIWLNLPIDGKECDYITK